MSINEFLNVECMEYMHSMPAKSVDLTLTDIPYGEVTQMTSGLSTIDHLDNLGNADKITFNTLDFCKEVDRLTKNTIIIFCGFEQFSEIIKYFKAQNGTTRALIWQKTNPVPTNGQYVYLSGIELAVWFKRRGAKTFNAYGYIWKYKNDERDIQEWVRLAENKKSAGKPKKSIYQLDEQHNIIAEFVSAADAARAMGKSDKSNICAAARKGCRAYGYYWKYKGEDF